MWRVRVFDWRVPTCDWEVPVLKARMLLALVRAGRPRDACLIEEYLCLIVKWRQTRFGAIFNQPSARPVGTRALLALMRAGRPGNAAHARVLHLVESGRV